VRIDEDRAPSINLDVMAAEVGADPHIEGLAHLAAAMHEALDGQSRIVGEREAVEFAIPEPGQVQRRLPHRLARNAGICRGPAVARSFLDQRDLLAEIRCLSGALFAGRAGTDHDEVV
jgi:hypothetical protein